MTSSSQAVDEFYRYLSGERENPLSPGELIRVFQTAPHPELLAAYRFALLPVNGDEPLKLDPDTALVSAIASARTPDYLQAIAYALRAGANANLYVATPGVGVIHVLAFAIQSLGMGPNPVDQQTLESVIALLLLSGARPNMMAFDSDQSSSGFSRTPRNSQRVIEWSRKAAPSLPLEEMSRSVDSLDPLFKIRLGIMLNNPELATGIVADDEERVFQAQASDDRILNLLTPAFLARNDPRRTPPLRLAQKYYFPEGYDHVIRAGVIPSFVQINDLLLDLKKTSQGQLAFLFPPLAQMLLRAVASGASLSSEQLAFLKTLSTPLTDEVTGLMSIPLWEKICRTPEGTLPRELASLLLALGYDPLTPKRILCEDLRLMSQTPPEKLIQAAETRQRMRFNSEMARPSELVVGSLPELTCTNRSLLDHPPSAYPDLDVAFYRDSAGKVWCFTSDMFENLLADPRNPHSGADLPPEFLDKIEAQVRTREMYGMPSTPQTFEVMLTRLLERDPLPAGGTYQNTEAFRTLSALANTHGISQADLEDLSPSEMANLTRSFNPDVRYDGLPRSLRLETFARAATDGLRYQQTQNPNAIANFFASMNTRPSSTGNGRALRTNRRY